MSNVFLCGMEMGNFGYTKNADCFGNDRQKLDYISANIRHFKKVTKWIISTSEKKNFFSLRSKPKIYKKQKL